MYRQDFINQIIGILLKTEGPMNIKEMSEQLRVSKKSVWNVLNSDRFIKSLGGLELIKKQNVGIFLNCTEEEKRKLEESLQNQKQTLNSINKNELENSIIIDLFKSQYPVSAKDLSEKYYVSRSSIVNELETIGKKLSSKGIKVARKQNVGYWLDAVESTIRQYFEKFIITVDCNSLNARKEISKYHELSDELYSVILHIFPLSNQEKIISLVRDIQKNLLGDFTDESIKEIIAQLLVTQDRSDKGFKIEDQNCLIDRSTEFMQFVAISKYHDINLGNNDYKFLWEKCISSRFQTNDNLKTDDKFLMFARDLLKSTLGIEDDEHISYLVYELGLHILRAAKRSDYGITTYNPILNKIKNLYTQFYAMVLTNINEYEEKYGISLNEDEIGYITIYVCAIVEKQISEKEFKVLVVCNGGIGQSFLISSQLKREFGNLCIVDDISEKKLTEERLNQYDCIISTVYSKRLEKYKTKVIPISDVIDDSAVLKIKQLREQIERDSINKLASNSKPLEVIIKYYQDNQVSRMDLIKRYTNMAFEEGYVLSQYYQSVVDREKRASTSIGKGIAIPHGNAKYIIKPAIFIVKNIYPIQWENELVDTVLLLILKFEDINYNKKFFYRLYSCLETPGLIKNIHTEEDLIKLKKFLLEEGE